jgi:hypothetical protein
MENIDQVLLNGIDTMTRDQILDVLYSLGEVRISLSGIEDYWNLIGKNHHVMNDFNGLKFTYSIYSKGYVQASKDKTHE